MLRDHSLEKSSDLQKRGPLLAKFAKDLAVGLILALSIGSGWMDWMPRVSQLNSGMILKQHLERVLTHHLTSSRGIN